MYSDTRLWFMDTPWYIQVCLGIVLGLLLYEGIRILKAVRLYITAVSFARSRVSTNTPDDRLERVLRRLRDLDEYDRISKWSDSFTATAGDDLTAGEPVVMGAKREPQFTRTSVVNGPIKMLLWCPQCATPHVDAPVVQHWRHTVTGDTRAFIPDSESIVSWELVPEWKNPPHKSHLCAECGTIWRPCDFATTGVASIATQGEKDTWWPRPTEEASLFTNRNKTT